MKGENGFNDLLPPGLNLIIHPASPFSEFYDFSEDRYGGHDHRTLTNFRLGQNYINMPNREILGGKGVYIILDQRKAPEFNLLNARVPAKAVVNIGQAGGNEPTGGREHNNSNFHQRIFKHALEGIGITREGPTNEQGQLLNHGGKGINHTEFWSAYRDEFNAPVPVDGGAWINGEGNQQFCLDHWWLKLIEVPLLNGLDTPGIREVIRTLEDYLILGYMGLKRSQVTNESEQYQEDAPPTNTAVSLGVIGEIFIT